MNRRDRSERNLPDTFPFHSVEDVWFWFIKAQEAKEDGAYFGKGRSTLPRPCEPADILKIVDRLYRNRRLVRDHLYVMRYYGRRQLPPDPNRHKEVRAFHLWKEAIERLEPILLEKGILYTKQSNIHVLSDRR